MSTTESVITKVIPARKAEIVDFPEFLKQELKDYLTSKGLKGLYSHQVEMLMKALDDTNCVITTSTSSGKTLSFLLPVAQTVLNKPAARILAFYPTKALAADQHRTMEELSEFLGKKKFNVGRLDGDTPIEERQRILTKSNVILTNPDFVNGLLSKHNKPSISFLLQNLTHVIVDEAHTYRGIFGSNVAFELRRLLRLCRYYGASPVFLLSSATISNPIEHASKLCGNAPFELIDKDGSPSAKKNFYLIPHCLDTAKAVSEHITKIVNNDERAIAFVSSRKESELDANEAKKTLSHSKYKSLARRVSSYNGSFKPSERKKIETNMIENKLNAIVSTNALEVGINIGNLSNVLISGFPGTKASLMQQAGRCGRNGQESNVFVYLNNSPVDTFIASNPEWLFNSGSESAIVDTDNIYIEYKHVCAAAAELPLTMNDVQYFQHMADIIPILEEEHLIEVCPDGSSRWIGDYRPTDDLNLRNIESVRYELVEARKDGLSYDEMKRLKWTVTEMGESTALNELYPGAIYLHNSEIYQVISLNQTRKYAVCKKFHGDYYTVAFEATNLSATTECSSKTVGLTNCYFGDVVVDTTTLGFKKLSFNTNENLGSEEIAPLHRSFETEGFWLEIPSVIIDSLLALAQRRDCETDMLTCYFDAMAYALKTSAQISVMAERSDIKSGLITQSAEKPTKRICLFDNFEKGIGFAEKAYELAETIIRQAIIAVEGCTCDSGCPACVGRGNIKKEVILWCLNSFLEEQPPLEDFIIPEMQYPEFTRPTRWAFDSFEDNWDEFINCGKASHLDIADFLDSSVKSVGLTGSTLRMEMHSEALAKMAEIPANQKKLLTMVRSAYEVPENFQLEVYSNSKLDSSKIENLRKKVTKC